ncbi:hypothetical protein PM082_024312 [Marasmius tenuissimus]|nr:hypothetical protein PM082_024312 [Marasmius tenuissimus]
MAIAQPSILIAGAGPVGLVLALSLLRNRVPVRIINKQLTHSIGHRGSGLHPRTLEHYKILGILPQVFERSGPWPKMRLYSSPESPDGKPLQEFSMIEELEPTAQYPIINSIMFSQDRHEALLRQVLLEEYDTAVEMGTELQSFVQTPDDVQARLVKHTADGKQTEETARFEYVIGTDGARSVVRK